MIGDRLLVSLLGEPPEALDGEQQPDSGREQRGRRERHRDPVGAVDASQQQHRQGRRRAERGEEDTGSALMGERIGARPPQPDRHRHEQKGSGPGNTVGDGSDLRGTGVEEVERVAYGVHHTPEGDEPPGPVTAPGEKDASAHHHRQQQHVSDRVGEIRRRRRRLHVRDVQDAVERERRA